jgi:hypothetical protein
MDMASCMNKPGNSAEVTGLQQRVGELNTIVANLTKEIASIKQYIREKVEPTLTKVLSQQVSATAPVHVPALAPVHVPAPAYAPAPAILPLEEIHLSTPFIEPEIVTILESNIEPVFENIILSIGC